MLCRRRYGPVVPEGHADRMLRHVGYSKLTRHSPQRLMRGQRSPPLKLSVSGIRPQTERTITTFVLALAAFGLAYPHNFTSAGQKDRTNSPVFVARLGNEIPSWQFSRSTADTFTIWTGQAIGRCPAHTV